MNSTDGAALVRAEAVGVRFDSTDVFRGVDLDIAAGSRIALTGRSGSGKTTLLLVLAGLLTPTTGRVRWPGLDPDPRRRRAQIGMVFQAPSLMPELTALENVTLPMRLRGTDLAEARTSAAAALAAMAIADAADALPAQLSGGQQQRVAIARALAGNHRLVLADEPAGALDRAHARQATLALRDGVAASGGALVIATHDLELAAMLDRQLVVTAEGHLARAGVR